MDRYLGSTSWKIRPIYWEIRIPVSSSGATAIYEPKSPTRFSRIVGNVQTDGVEILSLKIGEREQLSSPPLDLSFLQAENTNTLALETASIASPVKLVVKVRRKIPAKVFLIGPAYNGEHRTYRLSETREAENYTIVVEGVEAQDHG